MTRAAWFYGRVGEREQAEFWSAAALEANDPRPAIRTLLDAGRLSEATARIDAYALTPGGHPHRQALIDMWCAYAYRFELQAPPQRCMVMGPGLAHNLWIGVTQDIADNNAMNSLERAIVSEQAALNKNECIARRENPSVLNHTAPPFETYLRQLDISVALCLGAESDSSLVVARRLADGLIAQTPVDPWALLFDAQVDEALGQKSRALEKRRKVAELWSNADPELPLVDTVRRLVGLPQPTSPMSPAPSKEAPVIGPESRDSEAPSEPEPEPSSP